MSRNHSHIRYAVVGLGYIAQMAVLPAFTNAKRNSTLTALVSDDPLKLKTLARKYKVPHTYSYDEYDECLASGDIDAVFITLPNSMHCDYVVRAARAGIHCLCEKPLAITEAECVKMINVAEGNRVHLMTAYRLHFDKANLKAIQVVNSGNIGNPRMFLSVFSQQIKYGNIRLDKELGGGVFYDMGIYCINASRYIFKSEPIEIHAVHASSRDRRFREIDEMTAVILRFPDERLAVVTSSFGASAAGWYEVIGTKGGIRVENAYEYSKVREHRVTINEKTRIEKFKVTDQFAPELLYFSDCILRNKKPEPSGEEGLADIRVIEAINRSAKTAKPVMLKPFVKRPRPTMFMEQERPRVRKPLLIHATKPSD